MSFCTLCGSEMEAGGSFCTKCGQPARTSPADYKTRQARQYNKPLKTIDKGEFLANYLSFIICGLLILFSGALTIQASFDPLRLWYIQNRMYSFFSLACLLVFAVVTTRLRGPDFSYGAMMALSACVIAGIAQDGSILAGFVLAVIACAAFGLMNGAAIVFLRVPAFIVTLTTSLIIKNMVALITIDRLIKVSTDADGILALLLAFVVAFAIAVAILFLRDRIPWGNTGMGIKKDIVDMLGYAAAALIPVLAGWGVLLQLKTSFPSYGYNYDFYIVLAFIAVSSSKLLKNNLLALGYVLVIAICITAMDLSIYLSGLSSNYSMHIILGVWAIIFMVPFYFVKRYESRQAQVISKL